MNLEGKINIEELFPHPKNEYYFDDMSGDTWDELLRSITTSGVTNAITITQDKKIISGHQRVRACKVLGIKEISYKMIDYSEKSENEEIKDLIESNLKQRVAVNPNPVKLGRCFNFLNEYYGFQPGTNQHSSTNNLCGSNGPKNQIELAETYNITQQTMNNYMRLTKMIPELEELVDTGIVTKTTALAIMKELNPEEQEDLIANLDATEKITKSKIQPYIDKIKELRENPPEPEDYTKAKKLLKEYKADNKRITSEYNEKVEENKKLQDKIAELQTPDMHDQYVKKICDSCLVFNSRISTFIEEVGGYIWLADKINEMPEIERKGYLLSVQRIKDWADTLEYNINKNKGDIIL